MKNLFLRLLDDFLEKIYMMDARREQLSVITQ
jgi:hypothetical protein